MKCSGDRLLRARRLLTPNSMGLHTGLLAEQTSTAGRVLGQQLLNHPTERLTLVGALRLRPHSQVAPVTGENLMLSGE